jgi:hypothetical protein
MKSIDILYCFKFDDQTQEQVEIELDGESLALCTPPPEDPPEWTKLDFHQCSHCPLKTDEVPHCPLTLQLVNIIPLFERLQSFDEVNVEVVCEQRTISQRTTAQRALSSLMGLIIATSGCPHTKFFRAMARFHLPFGSEEETLFRATSMYLLAQYFLKNEGKQPDLELKNLTEIYSNIHLVNSSIATRLRGASKTDASANALILLDLHAKAVPYVIEESLDELKYLFTSYFSELEQ